MIFLLQENHDSILLPDLKIQDFFDVILVFTELSMTEGQELPTTRWMICQFSRVYQYSVQDLLNIDKDPNYYSLLEIILHSIEMFRHLVNLT